MKKILSVLSSNVSNDEQLIQEIKERFIISNQDYGDFVIFSDSYNDVRGCSSAILPLFYIKFYNEDVIFLNIEDYLLYKDSTLGKPIVYLKTEDIDHINKNILSLCEILIRSDDQTLRIINNHELQQAI
jgi:hypothetical protein